MASYGKFKDFEIRDVVYLGDPPHDGIIRFDLVKWYDHAPTEVYDLDAGKKKIITRSCYSIAGLWWNEKEPCFVMESVGLRYIEEREDGLEEWLQRWCKLKEYELLNREEDDT